MTHEFGSSVAMGDRGAWYVVGAYRESSPGRGFAAASNDALSEGAPFSGALYGYLSNGVLSERLFVKASNADLNDWFGHSVAISGDESIVAAGAPAEASASLTAGPDDNSLRNTGAAYVFRRTAMEMEYLKAPDGLAAEGLFGFSVSLDNDGGRLLVGAPRAAEDGRAFLYSRFAADDVYGQPIELQAGYRANVISFGRALVLSPSGTLAFVSSEDRQGRVHVFGLDVDDTPPAGAGPEEWKVLQVLRSASPVAEEESFGAVISVDRQGRFVAVGAPEADSSASSIGGISPGSVYIFERESSAE